MKRRKKVPEYEPLRRRKRATSFWAGFIVATPFVALLFLLCAYFILNKIGYGIKAGTPILISFLLMLISLYTLITTMSAEMRNTASERRRLLAIASRNLLSGEYQEVLKAIENLNKERRPFFSKKKLRAQIEMVEQAVLESYPAIRWWQDKEAKYLEDIILGQFERSINCIKIASKHIDISTDMVNAVIRDVLYNMSDKTHKKTKLCEI